MKPKIGGQVDPFFASLGFFTLTLLYPTISGLVAVYVLVYVLKQDRSKVISIFWLLLGCVHVAGLFIFIGNPGAWMTPGFIVCLISPIFAVSTALGLHIASYKLTQELDDPARQTWLRSGTFLIPVMQVATALIAILLVPSL